MMRCKVGTARRRAITVSATEEYLELRVDSILELLRFTGVALAAIRMGRGGSQEEAPETDPSGSPAAGTADAGEARGAEQEDDGRRDTADQQEDEAGFDRDVYLSYRSFRIQIA